MHNAIYIDFEANSEDACYASKQTNPDDIARILSDRDVHILLASRTISSNDA